ncbi:MAG: hypothetical protein C0609_03705 [Deltaproteobacteria bacterium]|nr:MAG: hypothetical protein C0609_03705 [Deltaproteobacteria bacterium]
MKGNERRRYTRKKLTFLTKLQVKPNIDETIYIKGVTANVSSKGAYIESKSKPSVGSVGTIEFILPDETAPMIAGEISWTTDNGFGFEFEREHVWIMGLR